MSAPDRAALAAAQQALVDALVAGGPMPAGFDPDRVGAVRAALVRKRAGEVAKAWPGLAASYGDRWYGEFAAWADGRPTLGAFADGFGFATDAPELSELARLELAERQVAFVLGPDGRPRRRRGPVVRRVGDGVAVGLAGRVLRLPLLRRGI